VTAPSQAEIATFVLSLAAPATLRVDISMLPVVWSMIDIVIVHSGWFLLIAFTLALAWVDGPGLGGYSAGVPFGKFGWISTCLTRMR